MTPRRPSARLAGLALWIASVAGAQPAPAATTPNTRSPAMHEFAFLFRIDHVPAGADLARRNAAARDWALARRAEGTLRSASPLEDGGAVVGAQAVTPVNLGHPIASVLVIAADTLDAAVALAKTHPGLAFGTTIEVRPVKAVSAAPRP